MPENAPPDPAPPAVAPAVLDDLRARLRAYRRVAVPPGHGWGRGVDGEYLAGLVDTWAEEYDWRKHEARIRALPWALAGDGGPAPIRAIHATAVDPDAPAVLLLHGWPDSILRFERVLPLLKDLHVVAPALPGYPFAAPVADAGLPPDAMAAAIAEAMDALGHRRYVVSAGDVGSNVAEALAWAHPDRVAALHLTDVPQQRFLVDRPDELSDAEREYVRRGRRWQRAEGGYMHEQATKPHTLAVGLGDSPAGLAAWILEKLRTWTDCGGDVESVFSRDELLTWITAYWVSGAIGTSFTPYVDSGTRPTDRIQVPVAFTIFPGDLVNAPREFAERFYDVRHWSEPDRGGHFAAWERPDAYVDGVRAALALAGAESA